MKVCRLLVTALLAATFVGVPGCGGGGDAGEEVAAPPPSPEPLPPPGPASTAPFAAVLGGSKVDEPWAIRQTADNGFILAGRTTSYGAGQGDILLVKFSDNGAIAWQKTAGGANDEVAYDVRQTADGGYVAAGTTASFGAGKTDVLILKLSPNGSPQWQRTYGGAGFDVARSVRQTTDGGYVVAGFSESFGNPDQGWILKLDASGGIVWQKAIGGSGDDWLYAVEQVPDGYVAAGMTYGSGAVKSDAWVVKLNGHGDILWQKRFGGAGFDEAYSVCRASDGGYVVAGMTRSYGAGGSGPGGFANPDAWLLKLSPAGDIVWQKAYGGTGADEARSVERTSDNGFIVAGYTSSPGSSKSDFWLLGTSDSGEISWQRRYGGSFDDIARAGSQTRDGGFIVAGTTASFGADNTDILMIRTDAAGVVGGTIPPGIGAVASATATTTAAAGAVTAAAATATSVAPGTPAFAPAAAGAARADQLTDASAPSAPSILLQAGLESDSDVISAGGAVRTAGAGVVTYEPGPLGQAPRFTTPTTGHAQIVFRGDRLDFADVDDNGGKLEFWMKFNEDPHVFAGNKLLFQAAPINLSVEIYGSNPYLAFEFWTNAQNPRTGYRFMTYTGGWSKWTGWQAGEWHKITLTWKRNEGEGNAEMHLFIDDTQAGCPPGQCDDYFGYLPEPCSTGEIVFGNFGGGYGIDFAVDELTSIGSAP